MKYDVVVVGGGPAGFTAARMCAKAGLKTAVFEEHRTLGMPLKCGEGISFSKIKELKIPFTEISSQFDTADSKLIDYIDKRVKTQRFFFGDGGIAFSRLDTVTINRPRFDRFLANAAEVEGAKIFAGERIANVVVDDDKVTAQSFYEDKIINEQIEAQVLIAADGTPARISRALNLPAPDIVQGVEVKVEGIHTDGLDFYFDQDLFPMGYGWVFPKKTDTNIGLVVSPAKKPRDRLTEFLTRLQKELDISEFKITQEIAGIIPATGPVAKTFTDRVLVVGDAAGLTNSLFYGGIAIAIHSAQLAAYTTVEAFKAKTFHEDFLSQYQQAWQAMPYANPKIVEAHNVLYNEITNAQLQKIGKLLDGMDITHLSRINKMKLVMKAVVSSDIRPKIRPLQNMIKGFKYSRDWGF